MIDSYFELIDNPVNKQAQKLTEENQKQAKMIGKLMVESNEIINHLKTENKNILLEKKRLFKERNRYKNDYINLKNLLQ